MTQLIPSQKDYGPVTFDGENPEWLNIIAELNHIQRIAVEEPERAVGLLDNLQRRILIFIAAEEAQSELIKTCEVYRHYIIYTLYTNLKDATCEFSLHEKFRCEYKRLLGEKSEIVKVKTHPKHIPDFFVKIDGRLLPVEIKAQKFGDKAQEQLKRYMKFYGCENGIAVAPKLSTKLDQSIGFIALHC